MVPFRDLHISKYKLPAISVIIILTLAASDGVFPAVHPGDRIDWYNKYFPMEKVYLHTDKYLYKAGETIWFKGYVASLTGERTPYYSNDLYIKILDQQNDELIYRRYPIVNNTVKGYLSLPKSTLAGRYYLLAYTGWMKNGDPGQVFSKELAVVKNNKRRITADFRLTNGEICISDSFAAALSVRTHTGEPVRNASVTYFIQGVNKSIKQGNSITDARGHALIKDHIPLQRIRKACFIKIIVSSKQGTGKFIFPLPVPTQDVQLTFNPAHDYLLKGCENRVSFRTATKDGVPVCCEGEIINQAGKAVISFRSGVNGYGSFSFIPLDQFYKARIISPPGDSIYFLPRVLESGIYVDYQGIKGNVMCHIVKVAPAENMIKTSWIATTCRRKYWSSDIEMRGDTSVEIPLPEDNDGLVQVSVFSEEADLLYDNLVKGEERVNPVKIVADKSRYGKHEKVTAEIIVTATGKLKGNLNLSVSVSQKHLAENNHCLDMDAYMAYENRLPDVIFRSGSVDTNAFLMAEKPFPVNWETIFSRDDANNERFYNRDGLTGIVYDKRKIPVGYAKVKAINIANWQSYETQCDESGIFRVLFGSDIIDFNYLNINAFDASGKTTLWPSVDQDFSKEVNNAFLIAEQDMIRQKIADIYKFPYPDVLASFQYPEKRKKYPDREVKKISSPQQYVNYFAVMDIIMDLKPFDIMNNQIFFKGFQNVYPNPAGALIVVDGLLQGTHVNVIHNLTPPDIVYIDILTTPAEIRRYTNLNYLAVIEITTVRGVAQNRMLPGLSGIDMLELNLEFHSPDYTLEKPPKADARTTLYWNPELLMPAKEERMTITFYTSDVPGTFLITVQGFDDAGKPVSAKAEFVVRE